MPSLTIVPRGKVRVIGSTSMLWQSYLHVFVWPDVVHTQGLGLG